ncbi:hypothetical protein [Kitasatospora sp. NPDC001132]
MSGAEVPLGHEAAPASMRLPALSLLLFPLLDPRALGFQDLEGERKQLK